MAWSEKQGLEEFLLDFEDKPKISPRELLKHCDHIYPAKRQHGLAVFVALLCTLSIFYTVPVSLPIYVKAVGYACQGLCFMAASLLVSGFNPNPQARRIWRLCLFVALGVIPWIFMMGSSREPATFIPILASLYSLTLVLFWKTAFKYILVAGFLGWALGFCVASSGSLHQDSGFNTLATALLGVVFVGMAYQRQKHFLDKVASDYQIFFQDLKKTREVLQKKQSEEERFFCTVAASLNVDLAALFEPLDASLKGFHTLESAEKIAGIGQTTQAYKAYIDYARRILDLSQPQKVSGEDINLGPLILERMKDFCLFMKPGFDVQFYIQTVFVKGDPNLILRIVDQLLLNAIRYAQDKPVIVRVTRCSQGGCVSVSDYADPLTPSEAANFFEGIKFSREDDTLQEGSWRSHQRPRGMLLLPSWAQAMAGSLSVSVDANETTFALILPYGREAYDSFGKRIDLKSEILPS